MMSRREKECCHGTIMGYRFYGRNVTVYMVLDDKKKSARRFAFKIKTWSLNHRLQELPIFRKDGSLDFESLEGMPVSLEIIQCGNRVFVKKIVYDLSYYGVERGMENG